MTGYEPYAKVHVRPGGKMAKITVMRYIYRPGSGGHLDAMPFTGIDVLRRPFESQAHFKGRVEKRAVKFLADCRQDWAREKSWEIR